MELTLIIQLPKRRSLGEVKEFCDPRIQSIKKTIEEVFNVDIHHHSLYFYGTKKES